MAPARLKIAAALAVALNLQKPAAGQSIDTAVNQAIDRAAVWLLGQQSGDGSWSKDQSHGSYPVGATAFTAYTLRRSGVPAGHEAIRRALEYLTPRRPEKTYCAAAKILLLDALGGTQYRQEIERLADWLEEVTDPDTFLWAYPAGKTDLSNSQFAALGLWAAAHNGYEASSRTWIRIVDALLPLQNKDGGFGYRADYHPESSGGMTAAGITMLALASRELAQLGTYPAQARADSAIAGAWKWLDTNYSGVGNPAWGSGWIRDRAHDGVGSGMYHHYYLYGIERVAALCEREEIGGRDWYREGAIDLLKEQHPDGHWGSIHDTCLALLFLRRATFSYLNKREYTLAAGHRPVPWRHTTSTPSGGWQTLAQETWNEGLPPFGPAGAGHATWTSHDLWAVRTFDHEGPASLLRAFVKVDDQATFWINGVEAARVESWTNGRWIELGLPESVLQAIKPTDNKVAAHVVNTGGAGFFDLRFDPLGLDVNWDYKLLEKAARARGEFWKYRPWSSVPWIKDWVIMGPVQDPHDTLFNDTARLPDASPDGRVGQRQLNSPWREVHSIPGRVELGGSGPKDGVWWATVWLDCKDAAEAALWVASPKPTRVLLDGEVLLSHNLSGPDDEIRLVVPLALSKGIHQVTLKFSGKGGGDLHFSARVAALNGAGLSGVVPTLTKTASTGREASLAIPNLLPPGQAAANLPRSSSRIDFNSDRDLDALAISPCHRDYPRRQNSPSDCPTANGVLVLKAPYSGSHGRVYAKLPHAAGRSNLELTIASSTSDGSHSRLRIFELSGEALQELGVFDVRKADGWKKIEVPFLQSEKSEHSFVFQFEDPGSADSRLFLDDLQLR